MSRTRRIAAVSGGIIVIGAVQLVALAPWKGAVVAGTAMALLMYGLVEAIVLAVELRWPSVSPFDRALSPETVRPDRPPDLERLEALLGWRTYSPRDFDLWPRPVLASLVRSRLLAHQGIDVDRDPEAAERALAPELWAIARPGPDIRPSTARGTIGSAHIGSLLNLIEAI